MNQLFDTNLDNPQKKRFINVVMIAIVLLALFLGVKAISAIKEYSYIGGGIYPSTTITVSGTGEVFSIPDTGSFSFSVVEESKTVKDAQDKASKKINAIIDALKAMNIEDKDIKTVGYNSGPKYEWRQGVCPLATDSVTPVYCPPGKNVLTGYEVSQTISVKVRKTEDAGNVLTKVGELGATNISNLDFVVDDMDAVKAEARDKAIANAKEKAKTLSKSLGIKLVKIIGFSDSNDYPPVYYGVSAMEAKGMGADVASVAPQVPVGENKTVSNVSITYEVK
ncbi:MAG: SIMPL domain-containing protein [Candidatus Zambryskibacteria bacterium]|nr:SIMPL domain-containing protein [Candidatus Zambryskibacteria bacterium]